MEKPSGSLIPTKGAKSHPATVTKQTVDSRLISGVNSEVCSENLLSGGQDAAEHTSLAVHRGQSAILNTCRKKEPISGGELLSTDLNGATDHNEYGADAILFSPWLS